MENNLKEINGRTVSVGMLPPTKAIKVQVMLVNLIGPALFSAITQKDKSQEEIGQGVMMALASRAEADTVLDMIKLIMECVTIDGKGIRNLDEAFIGRNMDMWKTLIYALQVNFSDFFVAARSVSLGGAATQVASN